MTEQDLIVGARVEHDRYGVGYVSTVGLVDCEIIFERGGKMNFTKRNVVNDLELVDAPETDNSKPKLTLDEVEKALSIILDRYNGIEYTVEMGDRWNKGTLILKPGNDSQAKEIPLETFFHKIVMVRDRLRVMEQSINSHKKLTDEEKFELQQYITRIYGSLTSFNLLFKEKEDYFVGTGGSARE
jgi:hypothetical protein